VLATATALGFPLAATIGVVDGVPSHTASEWPTSAVNVSASFAEHHIFPLSVSNLPNGSQARFIHAPNFA